MTAGVRVLRVQCLSCIFRPGNLMQLNPGRLREMVEECRDRDAYIPCHELTQQYGGRKVAGPRARGAVCAGYMTAVEPRAALLQVAERLGCIEWVEPPATSEFIDPAG